MANTTAKDVLLKQYGYIASEVKSNFVAKADEKTYSIAKAETAETGFLATYELHDEDGTLCGAKINIPKDFLVKSGEVKTVTVADQPVAGYKVGDKYIDFVINSKDASATDEHMYILVSDLVEDAYTGSNSIDITDHVVSLKVDSSNANGLEVTAAGLKLNVATTSAAGAMSSADKGIVDAALTSVGTATGEGNVVTAVSANADGRTVDVVKGITALTVADLDTITQADVQVLFA